MKREVEEETGLSKFTIEKEFEKNFLEYKDKKFERYFFVVKVDYANDSWEHEVNSEGMDSGLIFKCFWLEDDEFIVIHDFFQTFLDPEHIPCLFD